MSNPKNDNPGTSSLLRRLQALSNMPFSAAAPSPTYVPSVPDDKELRENFQPFSQKSDAKKRKMGAQMQQIAVLLEQRRIVPENPDEHRRLAEQEISNADRNGAASTSVFKAGGSAEAVLTPASLQLIQSKRPDGQYEK